MADEGIDANDAHASANAAGAKEADANDTDANETDADETNEAPPPPVPVRPMRRYVRPILLAVIAAIAVLVVWPSLPRSQRLRLHFGTGSSRIVRATARVGRGGAWDRESTWSFDGGAPPAVTWVFDLANGAADVEVDLASHATTTTKHLRIDLEAHELDVDLADATRGLP